MSSLLSSLHLPPKSKLSPSTVSSPTFPSPSAPPSTRDETINFRRLVFNGTIPLHVVVARSDVRGDAAVESYYIQAPRISYLPLLLPELKRHFLPLLGVGPGSGSAHGSEGDEGVWFSYEGVALKWHWPIGLLYDYRTAHPPSSSFTSASTAPSTSTTSAPASLASVFSPPPSSSTPTSPRTHTPPVPWRITLHLTSANAATGPGAGTSTGAGTGTGTGSTTPSGGTELLQGGSKVEECRKGFMNMLKEADYLRHGSVKRVTNLKREQQDAVWEGVVGHDFPLFHSTFSRLVPPAPLPSSSPSGSASSVAFPSTSTSTSAPTILEDGNSVRSVPLRVYLPGGAPVLQELVAPLLSPSGPPATLKSFLANSLPLFFPPAPSPSLATPIVHGILLPLETELGWLGSAMCGADGWVGVVLRLG